MRVGSSPLMRGKRQGARVSHDVHGLIPARAGKTSSFSWLLRRSADHPRSREENTFIVTPWRQGEGSSPLTRGKLQARRSGLDLSGLIPAHAGKTRPRYTPRRTRRAHPRSRGENIRPRLVVWENVGSSPLTRGKRLGVLVSLIRDGLIPAHAGKTTTAPSPRYPTWAHPRSRGENPGSGVWDEGGAGSSPLTRGKLFGPMAAST